MSGTGSSAEAICADQVRSRDFTSFAAGLFVPRESQRALLALAAFNAEVAHVRDHVSQPMPGEIRLQWWRDTLTRTGNSDGADGSPVATEFMLAIKQYNLSTEILVRLIDAHVFDVYDDPMPDMAALEAHCRDTSSALFALRAKILGAEGVIIQRAADHAGIAEGLVDAMLSLPKHAGRRQLYLPGDLIHLKGAVAQEIFSRHVNASLKDVLAHLRIEARKQFDAAMAMLPALPPQSRPAFLPLAMVRKNLQRLERANPFDPPHASRLATLWTIWRAAVAPPFKA